ncbi:MAG TPA: CbtB-domain containing protein [Mycobacteriales bacterium]|nr:CbtB-domain containing protein [Mycobacteriales bacterium]
MSSISAPTAKVGISLDALSKTRVAILLSLTLFVALALYYFVGVDEGMTSVFGNTMGVHEWVHDARHFLGFPCH